jgi:hypothetical protein
LLTIGFGKGDGICLANVPDLTAMIKLKKSALPSVNFCDLILDRGDAWRETELCHFI